MGENFSPVQAVVPEDQMPRALPIPVDLLKQNLMGEDAAMEEKAAALQRVDQVEGGAILQDDMNCEEVEDLEDEEPEEEWGDQDWATEAWVKQLVEEELNLQAVLLQEKFEKILEDTLHPLQVWADWLHIAHEQAQEKIIYLNGKVGNLEEKVASLEGVIQAMRGVGNVAIPSTHEIIRVETAGGVLELTPKKEMQNNYFGGGIAPAQENYFAAGAGPLGGNTQHVQAVQVCAMQGEDRWNFNPLMGGGLVAGNPALLALHKELKTPHFGGEQSKWHQFVRDWGKWSAYVLLGAPAEVARVWKRDLFVNCLHASLKEQYENVIALKAGTTFEEIYDDLEKQFAMDNPHFFREEWRKVTLKLDGPLKLTDFLLWKSRYLSARGLVQDWTEEEDRNLVLKNLPPELHKSILEREAKEADRRFMARLIGTQAPEEYLKAAFEQALGPIKMVKKLKGAHMVEFANHDQLKAALGFQNMVFGGSPLTLTRAQARWGTEEIFDHVGRHLKVVQESRVLLEGVRGAERPQAGGHWARTPDRYQREVSCWSCERAGRPSNHRWQECQKRGKGGKGGKVATPPKEANAKTPEAKKGEGKGKSMKGGKGGKGSAGGRGRVSP